MIIFSLLMFTLVSPPDTTESRALAFLAREVPSWSPKHKCFSCHNNGDAARALFRAAALGLAPHKEALQDTTGWLSQPKQWDHNGGEGPFNDKVLATIQFAAALSEGIETKQVKEAAALARAAEIVAVLQHQSGSWRIDAVEALGSPITYGTALATYFARQTLQRADQEHYRVAIANADRWLRQTKVNSVLDAAAVVLALKGAEDREAIAQRQDCLALIRKGESKEGGWGPYVSSAPEVFDTALVVLALAEHAQQWNVQPLVRRGREFLIAAQAEDGSWRETTRPAGAESYAQRISTTGWATQALLATRPLQPNK